jgi:UDP-N-acetyl-D-glucosamine dehydrogenase
MNTYDIAVIGAGYVGMPHARTFAEAGKKVVLVDLLPDVVDAINRGESHISDVPSDALKELVEAGMISATTDFGVVADSDAVVIAVPTPLSPQREPDVSYIERAARDMAPHLHKGHLVVLESTTYPGTTRDVLRPLLEEGSGLTAGQDFHLAYAPERVDPGRADYATRSTPKVVGGVDDTSTKAAAKLYESAVDDVVRVSSPETAELTKLLENIFRSVNIALVNELARLCGRMKIDVWEVIEAAATKPFGFMSFKPGPGLGGHCIPIDPFYLTWKAREYDFTTEFIELAGKVNQSMPYYCRSLISQALNHGAGKSLAGSKLLVLGVSYKPDIGDMRESPALKIIELMRNAGAEVAYHDPFVPELRDLGLRSVELDAGAYDCVVIVTDHSSIDYDALVEEANLVVDFRNATGQRQPRSNKVWKL